MIVTIDGPAGSGKSTAARGLAERLGFEFLDTGAMYRAVALALTRANIDFSDQERVDPFLEALELELPPGRVIMNGEDVSVEIRTPEISAAASKVAAFAHVRRDLVEQQRIIAHKRRFVCEGRDQGTVAFPDAECKFFLTASPEARAERRHRELLEHGQSIPIEQVLAEQHERDDRDSSRDVAPLRTADDAIVIDTSNMTLEQVLDRMEGEVRRCLPG